MVLKKKVLCPKSVRDFNHLLELGAINLISLTVT